MSIDQYSPCLCGSGKKLKWCCQDKLRDAAQIYRLISTKQFGHAREALEKKLEESPDDPLFLRLKLDFLNAAAQEQPEQAVQLDIEAAVTGATLLLQRPHSDAAHAAYAHGLALQGTHVLEAALDYWERFFPDYLSLGGWLPYMEILVKRRPHAAWWLTPIAQVLRPAAAPVQELLRSLSQPLPGILGGPPYLPPTRNDDDTPLARAVIHVRQGMLRYALATAEAEADRSPEAAFLAGCLRLALGDHDVATDRLSNLLNTTESPGLILGTVAGLWLERQLVFVGHQRTDIGVPDEYADSVLGILSEGNTVRGAGRWKIISKGDWTESDAIDPDDVLIVQEVEPSESQEHAGALLLSVPTNGEWSDLLQRCAELQRGSLPVLLPVPLMLGPSHVENLDTLATALVQASLEANSAIQKEEYDQLKKQMFGRLLRGLARHPVGDLSPIHSRSLSELASSDRPRDRLIAQAIALLIERTLVAQSPRCERPWFVYEALGVEPPLFPGDRRDAPMWLATLDLKNAQPTQLIARLGRDPDPGADILVEALEVLFDRFQEISEDQRALVFHVLFYGLTEMPQLAQDILDRTHDRIRQVVQAGLAPKWITDYLDVFAGFARVAAETQEEEAHAEAATNLQRVISQYANADIKQLMGAIFGTAPVPGVPSEGPWSHLAASIRRGIGDWLSGLELVEFFSDSELGLSQGREEAEPEGGSLFVDFRSLVGWLQRFARPVVVAPAPAGQLWTPDQGPPPASPEQEQEKTKKSGLWVPEQE